MKSLFLTYENPFTLDAGDHIYTVSIIRSLYSITGNVDILYFDSNVKQKVISQYKYGNSFIVPYEKKNVLKFIFSKLPASIINRKSQKYKEQLFQILKNETYDLIFVNHFKMSYLINELNYQYFNAKTFFISHNAEYLLSKNLSKYHDSFLKRAAYFVDSIKTFYTEKNNLKKFDYVSCINENDQDFYINKYKLKNTLILRPAIYSKPDNLQDKKVKCNAIICGSFHWGPKRVNLLEFLNTSNFSMIKENGIKLYIVGKADKGLVEKVNKYYCGVEMTGAVDSTIDYYNKTNVAIVPEKLGGGFKLKIIEAAINKNLIIAIKGAITKSNFKKNIHYIECDTYNDIIELLVKIKNNHLDINEYLENAYQLVEDNYSEENLSKQLSKYIFN